MSWGIKWTWDMDGCARWRRPAQGAWQGAKEYKEIVNYNYSNSDNELKIIIPKNAASKGLLYIKMILLTQDANKENNYIQGINNEATL